MVAAGRDAASTDRRRRNYQERNERRKEIQGRKQNIEKDETVGGRDSHVDPKPKRERCRWIKTPHLQLYSVQITDLKG